MKHYAHIGLKTVGTNANRLNPVTKKPHFVLGDAEEYRPQKFDSITYD